MVATFFGLGLSSDEETSLHCTVSSGCFDFAFEGIDPGNRTEVESSKRPEYPLNSLLDDEDDDVDDDEDDDADNCPTVFLYLTRSYPLLWTG